MTLLLALLIALFSASGAQAHAQAFGNNCASYNPNPAGQMCINTGAGSTWVYPGGDLRYQWAPTGCAPNTALKCGVFTVTGIDNVPFVGTLANGETWCFDSGSNSLVPCAGGGGGLTSVSHDTTLTGLGTSGSPLSVVGTSGSCSVTVDGSFSGSGTDLDPLSVLGGVDVTNSPTGSGECITSTSTTAAQWAACATAGGLTGIGGNTPNSPGLDGIINVKNYGVVGSGLVDDTAAIQTALAASTAAGGIPVYFPSGTYRHTAPIRVTSGPHEIFGAGPGSTLFAQQNYLGPAFYVRPSGDTVLTYGAALVGTGNSLAVADSRTAYLELHEACFSSRIGGTCLGGLSAMDVEFWYKMPATFPAGARDLMESVTAAPDPSPATYTYRIYANTAGSVFASLLLTGGNVSLSTAPGTVTVGSTYDFALDYDGSTVRLFINGSVAASGAGSGTVIQSHFSLMPAPAVGGNLWPCCSAAAPTNAMPGNLDAIQISKVSRHTGAYTPATSKPTPDSNTLIVENWETTALDGMQLGQTFYGASLPIYFVIYGGFGNGVALPFRMHDMELCTTTQYPSDGLDVWAQGTEADHLACGQGDFYAYAFEGNDFWSKVHDNTGSNPAGGGPTFMFGVSFAEGIEQNNIASSAGVVGVQSMSGTVDIDDNVGVHGGVYYPFVCTGQCVWIQPFDDLEAGDPQFLAVMYFASNFGPSHVIGGELSGLDETTPAIIVRSGYAPIVTGTTGGPFSEFFNFLSKPTLPAVFESSVSIDGAPVSNLPQYVQTPACGDSVTLDGSGAGTVTLNCINTASICSHIDVTDATHAVTLSSPAANGVLNLSSGTAGDIIKVTCE